MRIPKTMPHAMPAMMNVRRPAASTMVNTLATGVSFRNPALYLRARTAAAIIMMINAAALTL